MGYLYQIKRCHFPRGLIIRKETLWNRVLEKLTVAQSVILRLLVDAPHHGS
jgi:hypothetical protein